MEPGTAKVVRPRSPAYVGRLSTTSCGRQRPTGFTPVAILCVPVRRMALGVAVVGSLLLPALSRLAEAQQASLNVAARLTAEPGVRSPLAIRVGPPGTLPRNSYLRIRGLPAMASLSDGVCDSARLLGRSDRWRR